MTSTNLESIVLENLDFTIQLPCEYEEHHVWHEQDDPAYYIIDRMACEQCGYQNDDRTVRFLLCLSGWERAFRGVLYCPACRFVNFDCSAASSRASA